MSDMPNTQIVSKVRGTPATGEAWLEMDAAQHLTVRCTKCGLREFAAGMAPGLLRLTRHGDDCGLAESNDL